MTNLKCMIRPTIAAAINLFKEATPRSSPLLFSINNYLNMSQLIGKPAPKNLALENQDGVNVELGTFIGNGKPSIIFFYPKDESYGCTKEVDKLCFYIVHLCM